jgi:hypothetical protein
MIHIKKHERALLFKKGDFVGYLKPGNYRFLHLRGFKTEILDTQKPFTTGRK